VPLNKRHKPPTAWNVSITAINAAVTVAPSARRALRQAYGKHRSGLTIQVQVEVGFRLSKMYSKKAPLPYI